MPNQERSTAGTTPVLDGPQWRALLEARWQARLTELTELSLAYHAAAEAIVDARVDEPDQQEAQLLLRRAVAARRKLEDVEEALGGIHHAARQTGPRLGAEHTRECLGVEVFFDVECQGVLHFIWPRREPGRRSTPVR